MGGFLKTSQAIQNKKTADYYDSYCAKMSRKESERNHSTGEETRSISTQQKLKLKPRILAQTHSRAAALTIVIDPTRLQELHLHADQV